ncbi:hypothetical protein C9I92_15215 [Photobacterium ganghwense]|uniref:Uncharacterized protein n=1 Tax=Photobacterium ganghwense TaxID=320778 RepID=A0A0J1H8D7_9GAMM|nr:hypothetical protein [Photobacterium ganghwense]KLV07995.1 hypothetical protein ABT57_14200 [Photobacterium ganghwense]PSU07102.1 hypothetical protein C9I92_15215 [Photobacterium ganghwense]
MTIKKIKEKVYNIDVCIGNNADAVDHLKSFISYVENNEHVNYFPLTRLMEASNCNSPIDALQVAIFFSSAEQQLLDITFCYFDYDGEEIEVDVESFREALANNTPPYSVETGLPIDDFEPRRLGFFCMLNEEML